MSNQRGLEHTFVEYIPDNLEDGVIYVSIQFATAVHKCACGCGREVVTPLSPTDWKLTYDGKTISLDPSIGNWSFPCSSHYWIRHDRVHWAPQWSREDIEAGRHADRFAKHEYFESAPANDNVPVSPTISLAPSLWQRIRKWLF